MKFSRPLKIQAQFLSEMGVVNEEGNVYVTVKAIVSTVFIIMLWDGLQFDKQLDRLYTYNTNS